MNIKLYAKKVNGGHTCIGDVEVPNNFGYVYKMPVKNTLSVIASPVEVTSLVQTYNYREFHYKIMRAVEDKCYFEI